MTFDPVEFFKSLSDAEKRSCQLALKLGSYKILNKMYDDVSKKAGERIALVRECVDGRPEKATLNEARILLLLLRDLQLNILESDCRNAAVWLACRKANADMINRLEAVRIYPKGN